MTAEQAIRLIDSTPTTIEGTNELSQTAQLMRPGAVRCALGSFASAARRARIYFDSGDWTLADSWTTRAAEHYDALTRLASRDH